MCKCESCKAEITPAQQAETDQVKAEFAEMGIEIRPHAPALLVLAVDEELGVHATSRPEIEIYTIVRLLRHYARHLEQMFQ